MKGPRRIYLIGFMGSGKSTSGRKLAGLMKWQFLDLDELIVKKYGKSIDEIFLFLGEKAFRQYETEMLHNLNTEQDTVISVGGGAPCFHGNLEYMKKTGKIVYLKMTPGQLRDRLLNDRKKRPLLKGLRGHELETFIEFKLAEREVFYLQAGLIIDGNDPDIRELAEKISHRTRSTGE